MSIVANPGYLILAEILGAPAGVNFELAIVGEKDGIIYPGIQPFTSPTPAVAIVQAALPLDSFNILHASIRQISPLTTVVGLRCSLYLARKTGTTYEKIVLLTEGIVSPRAGLYYPGSPNAGALLSKNTLQEAAWPAIGNGKCEITAGDNEYFIVRSCGLRYVAGAAAANRQPRLFIRVGSDYFNSFIATTVQTASSTRYWTFAAGWATVDSEAGVRVICSLPFQYVPPGKTFGFYMENEQVADSIDLNHIVYERYSI